MKTSPSDSSSLPLRGSSSFSPAQIQAHVRAFHRSGLSMSAYAREHRLRFWTLRWWLERAGRLPGRRPGRAVDFQAMPLSALVGPAWAAEVVGPAGVTVRLSAQAPSELVTQLIALTARS